jgi:hypothetical protein
VNDSIVTRELWIHPSTFRFLASLPFDPPGSSETRGTKRIWQIRLDLTQERNEFENLLPEIPPILRR